MVKITGNFNHKEEIPTTRFWLMLKFLNPTFWDSRWDRYIADLTEKLTNSMELVYIGGDKPNTVKANMEIKNAVHNIITKLEKSAWYTMPTEFLKRLKIPRNIRR